LSPEEERRARRRPNFKEMYLSDEVCPIVYRPFWNRWVMAFASLSPLRPCPTIEVLNEGVRKSVPQGHDEALISAVPAASP